MASSAPRSQARIGILTVALLGLALAAGARAQDYPWEHGPGIFRAEWFFEIGTSGVFRDSHPVLADVNGDGDLEVVVGATNRFLYVLDPRTGQPIPGWPQELTSPIDSSPAVGDVDGDGLPEIIVGCGVSDWGSFGGQMPGALYCFNHDGSLLWRHATDDWWDMTNHVTEPDGFTEAINSSPVLADVDSDGVLEIVIGAQDALLYVINGDGTTVYGDRDRNIVNVTTNEPGRWFGSVFRRDADNDGRWDEDPYRDQTPYPFGNQVPGFEGVDDDGDGVVDDWPAWVDDDDEDSLQPGDQHSNLNFVDEDRWEWPFQCRDSIWPPATVADLDGDGHLDIIQSADTSVHFPDFGHLYVLDRFADPLPGWGYEEMITGVNGQGVPWSRPGRVWGKSYRASTWNQISVADVDGDGALELFFGSNRTIPNPLIPDGGYLYGLNHDGTEIRDGDSDPESWGPFALTGHGIPGSPAEVRETIVGSPAIGDIDGDGDLEIVAVGNGNFPGTEEGSWTGGRSGGVYAWNHDGSLVPGYPHAPHTGSGAVFSGPSLADIDGDGDLEILYTTVGSAIEVWHHDGTPVDGAPIYLLDFDDGVGGRGFNPLTTTPAVGDIDGDGKVEIVVSGAWTFGVGGPGVVVCIEAGDYRPEGMVWPMAGHDARRSGTYSEPEPNAGSGDVNVDGNIDSSDLVYLSMVILGEVALTPGTPAHTNALITEDDVIDKSDSAALVNILLGH
jgi:hypothetical protein